MLKLFSCCAMFSVAPGMADMGELLVLSAYPCVRAKNRAHDDLADTFRAKPSLSGVRLKKRDMTNCLEQNLK